MNTDQDETGSLGIAISVKGKLLEIEPELRYSTLPRTKSTDSGEAFGRYADFKRFLDAVVRIEQAHIDRAT